MTIKTTGSPFGSTTRTDVLVSVRLLGTSFQRELARLLGRSPSVIQKALSGLERDGLVAGRAAGRTRIYEINPRYFARDELLGFLAKLAEADPDLRSRVGALRRRPRRAGKPL